MGSIAIDIIKYVCIIIIIIIIIIITLKVT